jgi:putative selenium metabolism protein SsnA
VTTVFDHHASPTAVEGSLEAIAGSTRAAGIRSCLCYEVSDRDGVPTAIAGIDENTRWIGKCKAENDQLLRAMVGLHAAFTLSDVTIDRAARAAAEAGVGCHIHLAEDMFDQDASLHRHACRVTERLNRLGVLSPKSIAAHGVHLSLDELRLLRDNETMLVHNPQSNMNNAVGIANLSAMKTAHIRVGLGTDAMTMNMLEELRSAVWIQRNRSMDPSAGFDEPVTALFAGNAAIAEKIWDMRLGRIETGAPADLVLIPYDPPTPLTSGNAAGHIIFGISQRAVSTTIANGRVLMKDGELVVDLDEKRVQARCRELAASLWKRW